MKSCTVDGCSHPHRARGLCATHYNRTYAPKRHRVEMVTCAQPDCGITVAKRVDPRRPRRFCSDLCRDLAMTHHWSAPVPNDHPSRSCRVPLNHPSRRPVLIRIPVPVDRECEWCGVYFPPNGNEHRFCSRGCKKRAANVRRRALESDGHTYSWTAVIRVLLLFGGQCPYCEQPIDGPPDPDHVVPLSRGGSNGSSNILPCCRPCNSDKRDLLLSEWNADRARRGLPHRITEWAMTDPRVAHLNRALVFSAHAA